MGKKSGCRVSVLCLLAAYSLPATAAQIAWTSMSSWVTDATTGSIAYKTGSIDITFSGSSGFETSGLVTDPFATTSVNYENIDTATHNSLLSRYDSADTNWSVEFDLVDTTLTSNDVFTTGQLFASLTGASFTTMTIQMFAPDDITPIDLTTIDFEQHALAVPNFDAQLDWNPLTGTLSPISEETSKNSAWGFFSPTSTDIGKIIITSMTDVAPDVINFAFGSPVPVPAAAWLFGSGLIGLIGVAKRKKAV